jgi:hypothetical protein
MSVGVSTDLNALGQAAYFAGDLIGAETYHQKVLRIGRQPAPRGYLRLFQVGIALDAVGLINLKRGDPVTARKYFLQTLSVWKKVDFNECWFPMPLEIWG